MLHDLLNIACIAAQEISGKLRGKIRVTVGLKTGLVFEKHISRRKIERVRTRAVKVVTTTTVGNWQKALNRQIDRQTGNLRLSFSRPYDISTT